MTQTTLDRVRLTCKVTDASAGLKPVVIVPDGTVRSQKGVFVLDQDGAAEIISTFRTHDTPLVVDYEHASLGGAYASPDGTARAAGWVRTLTYVPGTGLVGGVEWTDRARKMIRAKEYLFVSPVVVVRKSDRRAVGLDSVALTNRPAIGGLASLAASARQPNGVHGMKAKIEEVLRAETELSDEAIADLAERLVSLLAEDANEPEAMTAPLSPDALAFKARADQLELQIAERDRDDKLRDYVACGAISPDRNAEVYESVAHFAAQDWDRTVPILEALKRRFVPPQWRLPPDDGRPQQSNRHAVIANAAREFRSDPAHEKITNARAFVSMRLRDKGMEALKDEEAKQLAIT